MGYNCDNILELLRHSDIHRISNNFVRHDAMRYETSAQLSQRDRATLRVIEYFAKITEAHSKLHC